METEREEEEEDDEEDEEGGTIVQPRAITIRTVS